MLKCNYTKIDKTLKLTYYATKLDYKENDK
jgi:hypothetical protein